MWWGCVVSAARLMVFDRRRDFGGSSGDAAFGGLRCEDLCKHGRQLFVIHIHFRQGEYYVFDGIGCSKQGTVGNTVMYVLKKITNNTVQGDCKLKGIARNRCRITIPKRINQSLVSSSNRNQTRKKHTPTAGSSNPP
jgi:hypothetical protein